MRFSIFRDQRNAGVDRISRRPDLQFPAIQVDTSRVEAVCAKYCPNGFSPPTADQTSNSQDFAGVNRKTAASHRSTLPAILYPQYLLSRGSLPFREELRNQA